MSNTTARQIVTRVLGQCREAAPLPRSMLQGQKVSLQFDRAGLVKLQDLMRAEGYDDADFARDPAGFAHHVLYFALQQFNERSADVYNRGRRGESKVAEGYYDSDLGEAPKPGTHETFEEGDIEIYAERARFDDTRFTIMLKHPDKVGEFPLYRHGDLLCCSKDATCMTDVGELQSWNNVCAYFEGLADWEAIIPQSLWQRAYDWIMAQ